MSERTGLGLSVLGAVRTATRVLVRAHQHPTLACGAVYMVGLVQLRCGATYQR